MNTMIKIALFDENRYFSAGWQEALALHFSTYGKRTLLLDAQQVHEADLVFCYFPPGVQSCFCHFFEAQTAGRKTLYFSLRTPEGRHKRTVGTRCSLEAGVIYHDTPLVSALYQVSAELERRGKWPGRPGCGMNCVCQHRGLTLREQEIMRCMTREMGVTQIARMLDISVKTVSNHKMSVMRKMGFRRNAELYGWLRHSARPGAVGARAGIQPGVAAGKSGIETAPARSERPALLVIRRGGQLQATTLIASPPWEVSRYLAFMSLPVSYMVSITLSRQTRGSLVRRIAMRAALTALTAEMALRSMQGT